MNDLYFGFRIEIPTRIVIARNFIKKFNSSNKKIQIFEFNKEGKIVVEKSEKMLLAKGKSERGVSTGFNNFSLMSKIETTEQDVKRLIQIVNVLGNDKIIKEKISLFGNEESILNDLPELDYLRESFILLEKFIPGFMKSAWYYAPDAIYK